MQFQEEGSKMFQVCRQLFKTVNTAALLSSTQQPLPSLTERQTAPPLLWCLASCSHIALRLLGLTLSDAVACPCTVLSRCSVLQRFMEDLKDDGTIENQPSMQGRTMYMIIGPQKV